MLEYDSGSSAKLIRLGVLCPELGALLLGALFPFSMRSTKSGILSTVGDGNGVWPTTAEGVAGRIIGVDVEEDTEVEVEMAGGVMADRFIADCRGGDAARVDDECVPFVNNRETEAVAVDVLVAGAGAGVLGIKLGA